MPNQASVAQPGADVGGLLLGRRCFHLHQVDNVECSPKEISRFRQQIAEGWSIKGGLAVPVRLLEGPLNGIEILLKPTQVGDTQITFVWDLKGTARASNTKILLPPHGPLQIRYRIRADTLYEFAGFRLWVNEWRPSARGSEYLLRLNISA